MIVAGPLMVEMSHLGKGFNILGIRFLRLCLVASVCALAFVFAGCGSAVSIDDGGFSSGNSPHAEEQVIIQTRQDGDHLDVFTLGQPISPSVSRRSFTQEERERETISAAVPQRSRAETSTARSIGIPSTGT